jgi:hypothetical protein
MNDRFTTEANFDERSLFREACAFTLEFLSCAFDPNESRFEMVAVEPIGAASDQRHAHDSDDDDGGVIDSQVDPLVGHDLISLALVGPASLAHACAFCVQSHGSTQFRVGHDTSFERRGCPTAREEIRED